MGKNQSYGIFRSHPSPHRHSPMCLSLVRSLQHHRPARQADRSHARRGLGRIRLLPLLAAARTARPRSRCLRPCPRMNTPWATSSRKKPTSSPSTPASMASWPRARIRDCSQHDQGSPSCRRPKASRARDRPKPICPRCPIAFLRIADPVQRGKLEWVSPSCRTKKPSRARDRPNPIMIRACLFQDPLYLYRKSQIVWSIREQDQRSMDWRGFSFVLQGD